MFNLPEYKVELRLNGTLIGDVRRLATDLQWSRKRTRIGVDSISFTLNDKLLAEWCEMRGTTVAEVLKPLALDCRIVRDGVAVVGGYLATMPAYSPQGMSANLPLQFDGYLNYLDKVHLFPGTSNSGKMGDVVQDWITIAENRALAAGKGFGFKPGAISDMSTITSSFDNYKSVKSAITDRCDNVSGAGPFDVFFHPDKTYDVIADSEFGEEITDYIITYPTLLNAASATQIAASEVTGFASSVIGIGSGEISGEASENTAPIDTQLNSEAVQEYGYAETLLQESSVSNLETLQRNVAAELASTSTMRWQPSVKLTSRYVSPTPAGPNRIWIGDTITLHNNADYTDMTSGKFRVNAIEVSVGATGAEQITPSLSRGESPNTHSFASEWVRMQRELLALKTA